MVQVLRRRRLQCEGMGAKAAAASAGPRLGTPLSPCQGIPRTPNETPSASGGSESGGENLGGYFMSREAFSWLLKDLRSQVKSLVVEFLLLLDGGLLTNAAYEALVRVATANEKSRGGKGGASLFPGVAGAGLSFVEEKEKEGNAAAQRGSASQAAETAASPRESNSTKLQTAEREARPAVATPLLKGVLSRTSAQKHRKCP